jgi:hypothetical protein
MGSEVLCGFDEVMLLLAVKLRLHGLEGLCLVKRMHRCYCLCACAARLHKFETTC